MKKYEYLKADDPSEKELNKLGAAGWELVAVCISSFLQISVAYLKRELQ